MNKIKATELFNELVKASQKAYAAEDKNIQKRLSDIMLNETDTNNKILKVSAYTSEYNRFAFIKTLVEILEKYDLIENDFDILSKGQSDNIIRKALNEVDFDEIKNKI